MTIVLDEELEYTPYSNVCAYCKYLDREHSGKPRCAAFDVIPLEIWDGNNKHLEPYPGDNGILFMEFRR